MDDFDAVPARIDRPVHDQTLPLHPHGPFTGQEIASDHLDQRRLAGAVVPHKPDHLARFERERDVVDGLDGTEVLGNIGKF